MAAAKTVEPGSATLRIDGAEVTVPLNPKQFSTGSTGAFWQGKVDGADGRRYQTQVTLTLIGSKPSK
jgi:hypothetical protein